MSVMFSRTYLLAPCSPRRKSFRKSRTSFNAGSRRSQRSLLFIRENRDGGIEMIMRHGQVDKEVATSLYDLMRDAFSPELTPKGVMQRAELEIATLKERPNFDPKEFMDDRFLTNEFHALCR